MSINDRSRALTSEDLISRYNLDGVSTKINRLKSTTNDGLTKVEANLTKFINVTYAEDIGNIQKQLDKEITTWFYNGTPTLENEPAVEWTTEELKNNHLGDLYYDQETGYGYRFAYDSTGTKGYYWLEIQDSSATEALSIANEALDISKDHKRRVFFGAEETDHPTPPYDTGDIWFKNNNDIYRCVLGRAEGDSYASSDWVTATKYVDSDNVAEAIKQFKETVVETTYETKEEFTKKTGELSLAVTKNTTLANTKAQVFTSEPTTPYYVGDVYIKAVTINDVSQNLIYVSQVERLTGDYTPSDFSLQPSYASQSELKVTEDGILGTVKDSYVDKTSYNTDQTYIRDNYMTNATFEVKKGEILEQVSGTYETKDSMNNYYTKTQADAQIDTKVSAKGVEINESISKTYITQENAKSDISTAKGEAIDSANATTDSKLNNYSTTTEVSSSIDQKISDNNVILNASISKKIDGADVTKAYIIEKINDTTSTIQIGADNINLEGKNFDLTANNMTITSDNFSVDSTGKVTAKDFVGEGLEIENKYLNINKTGLIEVVGNTGETGENGLIIYDGASKTNGVTEILYGGYISLRDKVKYADAKVRTDIFNGSVQIENATYSNYITPDTISCTKSSTGDIFNLDKNGLYIGTSDIYYNTDDKGLTISTNGNSGTTAGSKGIWLGAGGNITLNPSSSSHAYVRLGTGSSSLIKCDGGSYSSKCLKENIEEFNEEDYKKAIDLLNNINIYSYDYKYNINSNGNNKNQFGFIIDEVEKLADNDKFFHFDEKKAIVTENSYLDEEGATHEDNSEEVISYKSYDTDFLVKYLLTICKAQQVQIDKLEKRISNLETEA